MILDIKRNCIYKRIELTEQETNILKALCDNNFISYREILDFTKINSREALRTQVSRLKEKTGINIDTKVGLGLILRDILFLDY